ncbi:LmbE family protein [Candidatus Sulfopaludibacter sp. SbA3]|nr:LmbE family protein [Candidatus Sulfopaludibacter sp. SbA3]
MVFTCKSIARFLTVLAVISFFLRLPGQQQPFSGTPDIEHALRKLNELGTFLMIAAHPDDERTAVLAYFARGRHMRTAYLSLTRGEGGQNLIGSEQGAQLGLIRTQELLAARQIDGAEQFFTRAIDFGFTRTADETMQKWGHDRILSDVVWVVRRYRPDVINCGFSGTPRDGHGQHQTSGILCHEVFEAAADAKRFPEQLRYVQPWQAKRLVESSGFTGFGVNFTLPPGSTPPNAPPSAGSAETGEYNPILGYSYDELAILSRSMHHSQGTGAMRRPGPGRSEFALLKGAPSHKDLFEGVDTTWNRLPGGAAVGQLLDEAIRTFEPKHPEKAIPLLAQARPLIAAIDDPLAKVKLVELDEALASCAGLWAEAQAQKPEVTPGEDLKVTVTVLNRSNAEVTFDSAKVEGIWNEPLDAKAAKLGNNQSAVVEFTRRVPALQGYSQPYWLIRPASNDVYTVDDQMLIGLPDTPAAAQVRLRLTIGGAPVELVRPVHYRYAERAEGERHRPMAVVPAVAVDLPEAVALFPSGAARQVEVAVKANAANASGELRLELPTGWKAEPASQPFHVAMAGEQLGMTFQVTPPTGETTATLRAVATVNGRAIASGMQVILYPHIPAQVLFPPSDVKAVRANVKVTAHKVGYITGPGDEMPDALRQLGLDVTLLTQADLEHGELARFDAVVAGVRAYNVRADLRANQPRLMEYVRNGGTYIVQYQTGDGPDPAAPAVVSPVAIPSANPITSNMGPYSFVVPAGNKYRVTVEEAPVAFPHPDSRLLQYPNHISAKDFEGWVQERGAYFAAKWDPHYETVLAAHDPAEPTLEGGELYTRYGKGVYIFTAYAWFRQLPAGVPGAYRLFANLLSAK